MARDIVVCTKTFSPIDDCGQQVVCPVRGEMYRVIEMRRLPNGFTYYRFKECPTHLWAAYGFRNADYTYGPWKLSILEQQINYSLTQGFPLE